MLALDESAEVRFGVVWPEGPGATAVEQELQGCQLELTFG